MHEAEIRAVVTPELAKKIKQEATTLMKAKMQVKTLDIVNLVLGYSDKHTLICFPSLEGEPDRNHYLFGYDMGFKQWVFLCFRHFCDQAKSFSLYNDPRPNGQGVSCW